MIVLFFINNRTLPPTTILVKYHMISIEYVCDVMHITVMYICSIDSSFTFLYYILLASSYKYLYSHEAKCSFTSHTLISSHIIANTSDTLLPRAWHLRHSFCHQVVPLTLCRQVPGTSDILPSSGTPDTLPSSAWHLRHSAIKCLAPTAMCHPD